jgi:hypothetical protein
MPGGPNRGGVALAAIILADGRVRASTPDPFSFQNRRTTTARDNYSLLPTLCTVLVLANSLGLPKSGWQACQTTHREPGLRVAA